MDGTAGEGIDVHAADRSPHFQQAAHPPERTVSPPRTPYRGCELGSSVSDARATPAPAPAVPTAFACVPGGLPCAIAALARGPTVVVSGREGGALTGAVRGELNYSSRRGSTSQLPSGGCRAPPQSLGYGHALGMGVPFSLAGMLAEGGRLPCARCRGSMMRGRTQAGRRPRRAMQGTQFAGAGRRKGMQENGGRAAAVNASPTSQRIAHSRGADQTSPLAVGARPPALRQRASNTKNLPAAAKQGRGRAHPGKMLRAALALAPGREGGGRSCITHP